MQTKVSIGATSVIGWLVAAGGALPIVIRLIEEGQKGLTLAGPEKYAAVLSIVSLAVTQLGRYAQAHGLIKAEAAPAIPQSAVKPDGALQAAPPAGI